MIFNNTKFTSKCAKLHYTFSDVKLKASKQQRQPLTWFIPNLHVCDGSQSRIIGWRFVLWRGARFATACELQSCYHYSCLHSAYACDYTRCIWVAGHCAHGKICACMHNAYHQLLFQSFAADYCYTVNNFLLQVWHWPYNSGDTKTSTTVQPYEQEMLQSIFEATFSFIRNAQSMAISYSCSYLPFASIKKCAGYGYCALKNFLNQVWVGLLL